MMESPSPCRWMFILVLVTSSCCLQLEVIQQEEGEQVQLHCISTNQSFVPNITWSKFSDGVYVPVELDKRMSNKLVSMKGDTTLHMLEIDKANRGDGGSYRCETQDKQVLQEVLLQIYKLPVIFGNSSDYEQMMWEEDRDMYCWADGYPGLSVIWTRANNQLFNAGEHSFKGQHLKVIKARQEYAGTYICTASISGFRNASVSREVKLIIGGPPHNYGTPNEFFASLGDNVTLPCAITGYPEPEITWSRTGKVMGANITRYLVTEVPVHEYSTNSSLSIIGVSEDDYETYSCEVSNSYGKSEVQYTIRKNLI